MTRYASFPLACAVAAAFAAPAPAMAQSAYGYGQAESPAAALARHIRTLASRSNDFGALIGAGKAALELGDMTAAAGFFARADDANPRSPLPQAGMGAVSVQSGEPQAALPYFTRALQLGANIGMIGADRGLAYDLLGRQADAQADYRAALNGPDAAEARRRLALSLAVSGDKDGALAALAPLMGRDAAAGRVRAFVLALTGDSKGAMVAIDAAMPGSWSRVAPFLQRLPALRADQKVAAVNLGIFPDSGETSMASASNVVSSYAGRPAATAVSTPPSLNRLTGIDELLSPTVPSPSPPQPSWQPSKPVQTAYAAPVVRKQPAPQRASATASKRVWLQLASGSNADALPNQFKRIKSKNRDLFDGITGFVAKSPDRARLVIGPFRSKSDAEIFAEDLETLNVDAFSWTNSESDQIVPLGTE